MWNTAGDGDADDDAAAGVGDVASAADDGDDDIAAGDVQNSWWLYIFSGYCYRQ